MDPMDRTSVENSLIAGALQQTTDDGIHIFFQSLNTRNDWIDDQFAVPFDWKKMQYNR